MKYKLIFPIIFIILAFSKFSAYSINYVTSMKDSLENLINRSEHDILTLHFSSILQVINSESLTIPDSNRIEDLYNSFYSNNDQFNLVELETYINGNKPIIVSWVSPTDGQVSFTWLTLPDNWDPDIEYPLYVDLHGKENIAEKKIRYMATPYYDRGDLVNSRCYRNKR